MENHSEQNISLKKCNEPTLFVHASAETNFEEKNHLHCSILNINKMKTKDELTSPTFYVQSLPFFITIKRENSTKRAQSDVLNIQVIIGKLARRWSSKFTIHFHVEDASISSLSFNKTYDRDMKSSQNTVSHSIDWEKLNNLKDLSWKIEISGDLPDGGYKWPSRAATGFNGIHNEGATCYINSMLQSLYCTNEFRRMVYGIPVEPEDVNDSFVFWLKYIFYSLQFGETSDIRTVRMIQCFDWDDMNTTTQQDIQEFLRRLMDKLEQFVEGTETKEHLNRLFVGQLETKTICQTVNYESTRIETFWDLQLHIDDDANIYGAFRTYLNTLPISE